ncbi:DUF4231 domain-containing protein [Nesterenkonia sp. K-15-9-6]|uniref:DUF4231 domain-containing protein n=1 Tax=Nesterenkonia sp. K-15-9-6 TaxID=3093918 RepID=UPI0040449E33
MTSRRDQGRPSEHNVLLDEIDRQAMRYQRLSLRFLAASLVCGAVAGFVALAGQPWLIVACLLALLAMAANLVATRTRWRQRWHRQRTLHEVLVSQRWRYAAALPPYDDENATGRMLGEVNFRTGAEISEIDEDLKRLRALRPAHLLATYLADRVEDQRAYFQNRASVFAARAKILRWVISVLYVAVGLVAVAEMVGFADQHLLGPTVAVVTSLQVWASAREWDRTARVYTGYTYRLDEIAADAGDSTVGRIIERTEDVLADETTRWLALNDFEAFDQHYRTAR